MTEYDGRNIVGFCAWMVATASGEVGATGEGGAMKSPPRV